MKLVFFVNNNNRLEYILSYLSTCSFQPHAWGETKQVHDFLLLFLIHGYEYEYKYSDVKNYIIYILYIF